MQHVTENVDQRQAAQLALCWEIKSVPHGRCCWRELALLASISCSAEGPVMCFKGRWVRGGRMAAHRGPAIDIQLTGG